MSEVTQPRWRGQGHAHTMECPTPGLGPSRPPPHCQISSAALEAGCLLPAPCPGLGPDASCSLWWGVEGTECRREGEEVPPICPVTGHPLRTGTRLPTALGGNKLLNFP